MTINGRRNVRVLAVVLAFLLSSAGGARIAAQGTTATILGTITDSSGGVVPGATIEVRNAGTGAMQSTVTNEQGRFTVPELPIGAYEVQASLQGFQTVVRRGISLTVGSRA